MASSLSLLLFASLILLTPQLWATAMARKDAYIVHMDISAMPAAFSSHHHWYNSLLSSERLTGTKEADDDDDVSASPTLIYTYSDAIHGFSALLSESQRKLLKQMHGFVSAYPDIQGTKDTTYTYKYLGLNPVAGIWPASKYGKDVIIGVIDSGILPEHPSFRDDGLTEIPKRWKGKCEIGTAFNASMCNKKLIGARYFNKGLLASFPNLTISMNSARDVDGHGTHTASTAAGNYVAGASYFGYGVGTARGIAPRARIAVYKVLWSEGGTTASDTLAAFDQAIADGVDVISLSMSFSRSAVYDNPINIATFSAMEKGILVSCSAGNRGPSFATVRNAAPWVLTVGATVIDRRFSGVATLGNGASFVGDSLYIGKNSVKNFPLYYNQSIEACDSSSELRINAVEKKVVVCNYVAQGRFEGRSLRPVSVAAEAKAAGALLLTGNSVVVMADEYECPSTVLQPNDSEAIRDYIRTSKKPTVSLTFRRTFTGIKPAPIVADFSARGPSFGTSMILKPDVVAPGTFILAAYVPTQPAATLGDNSFFSNFTLLYGTSMSCPHASGLAALLKSVHPDWSPSAIRSAMMTTANILDDAGQSSGIGAHPLSMGSGELNPNRAMDPGLIYDASRKDYVEFLCALNFTREDFQTIARNSSDYDRCGNGNIDLNYPSFLMQVNDEQSSAVQRFKRIVTNVGDDRPTTYRANLTTMRGFEVTVSPPKLVFSRRYQKASFTLTLEMKKRIDANIRFGFLTWVDDERRHVVRSPIVATTITQND